MAALDSVSPDKRPRIAIIGGGYAGMAAAVSLMDAGITDLTVYEAGPVLGGRARRIPGGNGDDDNGQHLCLGAYTELLKLMVRVGCDPEALFFRSPLRLSINSIHPFNPYSSTSVFSLRASGLLPAPLHLPAALLMSSGSALRERIQTLLALRKLKQHSFLTPPGQTVSALLDEYQIHGALRRYFWESLCLAALNTPPQKACAQTFLNILQDIAEGRRQASDLLIPKVDLSQLFPEPAAHLIRAKGAEVFTGCAIKSIEPAGKLVRVVGTRHQRLYHHIILAIPPKPAASLLLGWGENMRELGSQLLALPHERIATLTLDYLHHRVRLPFPMMGMTNNPIEWIFDRSQLLQSQSHALNTGRITCVISAPREDQHLDKLALTQSAHSCVQSVCGPLPQPHSSRLVVEKFATLSCRPDIIRPDALTPDSRVILAGDYVHSRYPSTLETAVRSGLQAARLSLNTVQT